MKFNKEVLPNNLRVISVPFDNVQSMTVLILSKVGSRFETKNLNGISHFLEHMTFKGTKKYPSTVELSSRLDGIGAEFNAFTSKEYTGFYVKAASSHIPLVVDILTDMILNPLVPHQEVERERNVILEEIRMYKDMPARYVSDIYEELVFGDHPLGWDTAGTEEALGNVHREEILKYLHDFYTSNNMVVGVAGDRATEGIDLLKSSLGTLENRKNPAYQPFDFKQAKAQIKLYFKETEQTHFSLGVRSYPLGHPKKYALEVLSNLLGGSMSSRLFITLRERNGLAYYVRTGVSEYFDAGTLAAQAGVEKKNLPLALKLVLAEFAKIKDEGVGEEELKKAKENLKGHLILGLEDSREVASIYMMHELLENKIESVDTILSKIDAVSSQEIKEVAQELLQTNGLNLAIIGPFKDESQFLSELKI